MVSTINYLLYCKVSKSNIQIFDYYIHVCYITYLTGSVFVLEGLCINIINRTRKGVFNMLCIASFRLTINAS